MTLMPIMGSNGLNIHTALPTWNPYAHNGKQWAKYTHSVANMRVGDDSIFSPNTWSDPGENICQKRIGIISEKGQDSVADFVQCHNSLQYCWNEASSCSYWSRRSSALVSSSWPCCSASRTNSSSLKGGPHAGEGSILVNVTVARAGKVEVKKVS